MRLVEPATVLFETGDPAVFTKAGGGVDPVTTNGLLEDSETERDSGHTTRQQSAWHLSVSTAAVGDTFGEGDTVEILGTSYEILDMIAKDPTQTVFLITLS